MHTSRSALLVLSCDCGACLALSSKLNQAIQHVAQFSPLCPHLLELLPKVSDSQLDDRPPQVLVSRAVLGAAAAIEVWSSRKEADAIHFFGGRELERYHRG
ncbi:hypothetical protein BOTBODRAFT_38503 [Botryobasidium botryosum FD-172 SS1]|uniref:Uncharacterized protein n=1 Tax=Botryobasidium botryosum (strain FD-172 SS1) TaxID=930990 RepID=A0A067M8E1_BOTB1|nr:hypothetical protein BOTBODRAFT_38503 [Botryobasidium botryosum FD-172 SS1]